MLDIITMTFARLFAATLQWLALAGIPDWVRDNLAHHFGLGLEQAWRKWLN